MRNKIKQSVPFLVSQAGKAIGGMSVYGEALGLPYATNADIEGKLADLLAADDAHKQTKIVLKTRKAALDAELVTGYRFMMVARDVIKPVFGGRYTQAWDAMGLVGSLSIPRTANPLVPVLFSTKGHLTATPGHENAALGVTAAQAEIHANAVQTALNAYLQQKDAVGQALNLRKTKAKALEKSLRFLLRDLHLTLDPVDPRWISFGFNKPGAPETPDAPGNLIAVLIGTNAIALKWNAAPRATHYRVWKRVVDVDTDWIAVGSPADLDFTIENLPGNSQVEVAVSAANAGGESQMSAVSLVQTL